MTLLIVGLQQFCVCCIRSGVTRCTLLMMRYLVRMCLAVAQDVCSSLIVPLKRSCRPRIRWCGTGGFQEQRQCFFIGLSCSIPTIVFFYFSLSLLPVYWLVLWGWDLRTDRVYLLSLSLALPTSFNNNNNNNNNIMAYDHDSSYLCIPEINTMSPLFHIRSMITILYVCGFKT